MSEEDSSRIAAALDYGFEVTNDEATEFRCSKAQLLTLIRAAELVGRTKQRMVDKLNIGDDNE